MPTPIDPMPTPIDPMPTPIVHERDEFPTVAACEEIDRESEYDVR